MVVSENFFEISSKLMILLKFNDHLISKENDDINETNAWTKSTFWGLNAKLKISFSKIINCLSICSSNVRIML